MTVQAEDFLQVLQQDPNDDVTRLVYADFLEEYGGEPDVARAELIRVQVKLTTLPPLDRQAPALIARQDELLARWERVWLGPWADVLDRWAFRRGFVEAITVDASTFLDHAPDWFAAWPTLAAAKLTRTKGLVAELASCPWLAHLRGLDLSDNSLDDADLAILLRSRFLCLVHALDLSGNFPGPEGTRMIANAPYADELTEIHLACCNLQHDELKGLLGGRPWRRLDLSSNWLYRRDLAMLADSPTMRGLVALDFASNQLGENGAAVLADSPAAVGLIDLGLARTQTGDAGMTALARSPHLRCLRSLDVRGHHAGGWTDRDGEAHGGLAELARSPLVGQLRRLLIGQSWSGTNGWVSDVLAPVRPSRPRALVSDSSAAAWLRSSRYLMPSQLIECDLEELWWLGDTAGRAALPCPHHDEKIDDCSYCLTRETRARRETHRS